MNIGQTSISLEPFILSDLGAVEVNKYHFEFNKWDRPINFDTYNGKPIVEYEGKPLFAELLVLRILEQQGFTGVWVDTYRNKFWKGLAPFTTPIMLDGFLQDIYDKVRAANEGNRKGCWDILAYKDRKVAFIELKRKSKDSIKQNQIDWLSAALRAGFEVEDFILAEWDFKPKVEFL